MLDRTVVVHTTRGFLFTSLSFSFSDVSDRLVEMHSEHPNRMELSMLAIIRTAINNRFLNIAVTQRNGVRNAIFKYYWKTEKYYRNIKDLHNLLLKP